MTDAEKLELKKKVLAKRVASLRHIARANGARIPVDASVGVIADHIADMDPEHVRLMWQDINTLDSIKNTLKHFRANSDVDYHTLPVSVVSPMDMTAEELALLEVNDPTVAVSEYFMGPDADTGTVNVTRRDWAVLRVTKYGTELLSYGGGYYQGYVQQGEGTQREVTEEVTEEVTDPETGEVTTQTSTVTTTVTDYSYCQDGETELLPKKLGVEEAIWLSDKFHYDLAGDLDTYTENNVEFVQVPCDLPGSIGQLIGIRLIRSGTAADGSAVKDLEYSLTDISCDDGNEGMIALPHDIWLVYDNTTLESAPEALLLPKSLVEGAETGIKCTAVEITYNRQANGLKRLRLVSDAFGDEYIISSADLGALGTSLEDTEEPVISTLDDVMAVFDAFVKMKNKLAAVTGADAGEFQSMSDVVDAARCIYPPEMEKAVETLLASPDVLTGLLSALSTAGGLGVLFNSIVRPTDKVREEDING